METSYFDVALGRELRGLRAKRGVTREQLAEAIDGMSAKTIQRIEEGKRPLTVRELYALAQHLKVTPQQVADTAEAEAKMLASGEGQLVMQTRVGPVPLDQPVSENIAIRNRMTEESQALEAGDQAPHRSSRH